MGTDSKGWGIVPETQNEWPVLASAEGQRPAPAPHPTCRKCRRARLLLVSLLERGLISGFAALSKGRFPARHYRCSLS